MDNDPLEVLSKTLAKLIEDRRTFAAKLAGPGEPEERERWRPMFVQIQQTIDAVEKAIKDEQKMGQKVGGEELHRPLRLSA